MVGVDVRVGGMMGVFVGTGVEVDGGSVPPQAVRITRSIEMME
jgi:hypothetical protein